MGRLKGRKGLLVSSDDYKQKLFEKPIKSNKVKIGDIILLPEKITGWKNFTEYVVEDTRYAGGLLVEARALSDDLLYNPSFPLVVFYQSEGFVNSHIEVTVIGKMTRTFV